MVVLRKGIPANLCWENALTEFPFGCLTPCKLVGRDKFRKHPENKVLVFRVCEKPVALIANDILMYVFLFIFLLILSDNSFRSSHCLHKTVVIDFTQGAGATAEAAIRLSCMYIGVDKDPIAEQVVRRRLQEVQEGMVPLSIQKAKWAQQMKWSIFSRESHPVGIAEIEDGQDGTYTFFY